MIALGILFIGTAVMLLVGGRLFGTIVADYSRTGSWTWHDTVVGAFFILMLCGVYAITLGCVIYAWKVLP